jgi:hypothetical protein
MRQLLIFVDDAAEPVVTFDLVNLGRRAGVPVRAVHHARLGVGGLGDVEIVEGETHSRPRMPSSAACIGRCEWLCRSCPFA